MKNLFSFLTISLGLFPVLKLNHFSILMIFWLVVAIYLFFKNKTLKTLKNNKTILFNFFACSALFWIYFFSFPFANDYKEMGKIVVKTLPILVFPLGILLCYNFFSKKNITYLFTTFITSTFLINFYGWIQVFRTGFNEVLKVNDFYHPTIRNIFYDSTNIHIPYLGLLTAFAALLLVYRIRHKVLSSVLGIFVIAFFLVSMYFYSARMALAIFVFGLIYTLFKTINSKIIKISVVIAIPILSIIVLWFSPIKERYQQSIETEFVLPHSGQQPHEVNYRYGISYCSFEILKQNVWFGVGVDHVQKSLNACYETFTYKSYEDFSKVTYNTHNQFMDFILKFGIIIGSAIIYLLFSFVFRANLLFQLFLLTVFMSFLTENILDRQIGVVFYSLFNAIFVFYKNETFEKNTSSRLVR